MARSRKKTRKRRPVGFDVNAAFAGAAELFNKGDLVGAESAVKAILDKVPNNAESINLLGAVAFKRKDFQGAVDCISRAVSLEPANPVGYSNLGSALGKLDRSEEAFVNYDKSLELNPNVAETHKNKGVMLGRLGRIEEAVLCYKKAIELDPGCVMAYVSLFECVEPSEFEEGFELLEGLKGSVPKASEAEISLHFSLGKMYDDVGDYDRSFENYKIANEIRKHCKGVGFDINQYEIFVNETIKFFDAEFFESRKEFGVDSKVPIFVVGMPRSGTTLVEQILSCHGDVFGAGELGYTRTIATQMVQSGYVSEIWQRAGEVDKTEINRFAEQCLAKFNELSVGAKRVIDKLPHNFEHLWLVNLMFPNCKVINVRRDARDTCLSCYFSDFRSAHGFKNDLNWLGRSWVAYDKLMKHWKSVLGIDILDVDYESVIADQEKVSREMFDFCDLEWDDSCLEFFKSKRIVKTKSYAQVRKPIYKSSVGRWRNYESHLGPLLEALGTDRE